MRLVKGRLVRGFLVCAASAGLAAFAGAAGFGRPLPRQGQAGAVARALGTVKTINGNAITLTPDKGEEVNATIQSDARILRIEPGQTSLKDATPITLADVQPGDRILIAGKRADDGKTILVTQMVAMKHAAVQAKQQQESEAWQRGIGGLVSSADPATDTITVKVATLAGSKDIAVHTSKQTDFRRYAPDSVKFDDAKPSTLDQIKPGDQLRARGTRSADGNQFTADGIVTGSFRNIAGTISAVDAAAKTIRLTDLATKQPVLVRFTGQSEIRKLTMPMARMISVRMKGTTATADAEASRGGQPNGGERGGQGARRGGAGGGFGGRGGVGGPGGAGARAGGGDLQQMLTRAPTATLADFQKGDAVMIVSTQGAVSDDLTAITMLGGVEPILEATPKGGQPMQLSPWSLGGGDEGGGDAGGDAGGGGGGGAK
ncbi:MAG TPA: DUF5666 domain-containing protein [Candidatus Acidoferrales bacterium]|nr:DUF5666 domain-containing protein [Candidatus Acidoferrales bacterium]